MKRLTGLFFILVFAAAPLRAERTTGATFLEIPVGGRPAALGGAYSALGGDAFAPSWNPATLASLSSLHLGGTRVLYIERTTYDYFGVAARASDKLGMGFSAQVFQTGQTEALDASGRPAGSFGTTFAAYTFALGTTLTRSFAVGLNLKSVEGNIAGTRASTLANDFGGLFSLGKLRLAGVLSNVGGRLRFIDQADRLPSATRLGAAYSVAKGLTSSVEAAHWNYGKTEFRGGLEWEAIPNFALRGGYQGAKEGRLGLDSLVSGFGFFIGGQRLDYAWLPNGDLGSTHYLSFSLDFGPREEEDPV